jgi:hypothetical protein
MSNAVRAFRPPSADELQRLTEAARRERSMFLAELFGLRSGKPGSRVESGAKPEPRAASAVAV